MKTIGHTMHVHIVFYPLTFILLACLHYSVKGSQYLYTATYRETPTVLAYIWKWYTDQH